jgi:hypothetical protein
MSGWRVRWIGLCAAIGLIACAAVPVHAQDRPANTLQEMWASLETCLSASRGLEGSEITLVFSLRRNGTLIGKPRISYSKLPDDPSAQREFVASVAVALSKCVPLNITDALGGAIAGRPMSIRLVMRRPGTNA